MITYVILFLFPQGFPFLFHAIKDSINLRHTTNLIFSLCRYNLKLAESVSQRFARVLPTFALPCDWFRSPAPPP